MAKIDSLYEPYNFFYMLYIMFFRLLSYLFPMARMHELAITGAPSCDDEESPFKKNPGRVAGIYY